MPEGVARWKQFKKEKQEERAPAGHVGMGLSPSMAEEIAAENNVSSAELAEFAEFMAVDIVKEAYLLGIVVEAMKAPLPEFWIECEDMTTGQYYYCNTQTRQTTWEHPLDKYFKNLLFVERRKYKERAKQGHRAVQGGAQADVTTKAQEQYLKAQLEEKDDELNRLKQEMEHSGSHDALRQLDKAKETRLLRQENSELKKQMDKLAKDTGKKEKRSWFSKSPKGDAGMDESSMRRVPDVDVGPETLLPSSSSTGDLPLMPPDSTRGAKTLVDREALWHLRENTRSLRHDLHSTRQDLTNLKMQLGNEAKSVLADIKLQLLNSGAVGLSAPGLADVARTDPKQQQELEVLRQRCDQLGQELEHARQHVAQAEIEAAESARAASEAQALFGKTPTSPGTSASDAAELQDLRHRVEHGETVRKDLDEQLRAKQDAEATALAVLGGRGGGNLRVGVEELLEELRNMQKQYGEASQELAAKAKAASGSEQQLSGERASFEIERNALLADIKSLSNQLEDARKQAAEQAAAGGDAQRLQAESLAQAQAQARELESEAAGLKQQLAAVAEEKRSTEDTLQRMRELQGAKEEEVARIRAQLGDANQAHDANTRQFEAQLAEAKGQLAASVQAKEALEEEQRAQFAQMQAREQKAAQECERMFKLVQQAHVKVQEKEKDFKKQLDAERARFNTAMQSEIDRRMEGVQAKYEEEARQRRKLFNIVQELQGNIRVYARVRPMLDAQEESFGMGIDFLGEHNDLLIENPRDKHVPKKFEFEKVFTPQMGQADVFDAVGPLCTSVMDGYNVCIFAYGQTGSGKTYSMEGPEGDRGVYYNAVEALFANADERLGFAEYQISVNLLEIYNEQVVDLLHPGGREASGSNGLEIRRGPAGVFVPGLTDVPVRSTAEVMEVLREGNEHRSIATTKMNEASSRSHSLLVVNVVKTVQPSAENPRGERKRSSLTLVDLAGSERLSRSEAKGSAMKEAQHINKSLSALADVIAARAQKAAHVPYRNSKLTSLLEDSLSGDSKTLMLVHLRPTADNISETLCTLTFAQRVRSVEMKKADAREAQRVAGSRGL